VEVAVKARHAGFDCPPPDVCGGRLWWQCEGGLNSFGGGGFEGSYDDDFGTASGMLEVRRSNIVEVRRFTAPENFAE